MKQQELQNFLKELTRFTKKSSAGAKKGYLYHDDQYATFCMQLQALKKKFCGNNIEGNALNLNKQQQESIEEIFTLINSAKNMLLDGQKAEASNKFHWAYQISDGLSDIKRQRRKACQLTIYSGKRQSYAEELTDEEMLPPLYSEEHAIQAYMNDPSV